MYSFISLDIIFIAVTLAQVLGAEETQTVKSRAASAFARIANNEPLISLKSNPVIYRPLAAVPSREERVKCSVDTDLETPIRNGTENVLCCEEIVRSFRFEWTLVLVQLSDYLRILSRFNCSQFEDECQRRPYGFSTFNHMTYERFCNESKFLEQCRNPISEVLTRHGDQGLPDSGETFNDDRSQKDNIRDIKKVNLTLIDLLEPCIQASLIDLHTRPKDGFFELKITTGPLCRIVWCGFPGYAYERYEISEWTCMPQKCRANVIILMVTCGILAVASTTTNILSLFVFANHRRLRDSQGIYKMSLATSDLLVGLFVFATAIETMRRNYIPAITLSHPSENGSGYPMLKIHSFTPQYRNFIGFFTTMSTSTSIYTLMVASFDRFMVVFKPLRYNLYTAKLYATKLSVVVWILGSLFAILPIIVPVLEFQFLAGFIETITAEGVEGIILLTIAFLLPIVLMIVSLITTIIFAKKNAKARPRHIPPGANIREMSVENRLAKTLSIMAGVFLLCLVPLSVLLVLHLFLEGVNPYKPDEFDQDQLALLNLLEAIFSIVFLSNSLWNFFIYSARSKEFRKSCIKLFLRAKQKLRSKLLRNSAKEARQRRTSAAISNSSQVQCNTTYTI